MGNIPESAIVTRTNSFSQPYYNLYNLLNNRSNIPDPLGNQQRKMIYTKMPHFEGVEFKKNGYPFMVLRSQKPKFTNSSVDNKHKQREEEFVVEIHSSDDMGGRHKDKGHQYFRELIDNFLSTMNSESNQLQMRIYFQNQNGLDIDDMDEIEDGNRTVYFARFRVSYDTRMQVSA